MNSSLKLMIQLLEAQVRFSHKTISEKDMGVLKKLMLVSLFILSVSCTTDHFRSTRAGESIQLIGGSVAAPGSPWIITRKPLTLQPKMTDVVIQLSIGSFSQHPLLELALLSAGIGPMYPDPRFPDLSGEVIYIYSIPVGSKIASEFKSGLFDTKWLDKVKASARDEIVAVYRQRQSPIHNIRDISSEYQDKLKFWSGYIVAFAYTANERNYRVIHAFKYTSGSIPDSTAFQDFSFILMERLNGYDRFDDFIDLLKSAKFSE